MSLLTIAIGGAVAFVVGLIALRRAAVVGVPATPRALRRAQRRQRADLRRALNRK